MHRGVSEQQVARRAKVSRTTVSFVLNNAPGKQISEKTRQQVLQAARALGYHRASPARRGAPAKRRAVALLVCRTQFFFSDAFIGRIIQGMSQVLNKRHWQLIVQAARPKEQDYPDLMRRLGADGAVLVNTHHRDAGLGSLIRSRFPLVAIGSFGDSRVPQVTVDNAAAAAHVTEYLLGLGHTAIAMILHAPEMYHFSRDRLEGYRRALRAAGVPYRAALVHVGDFTVDSGYRQMQAFLRSSPRPTAVFGGSDSMAAGALRAIHDAGLRVPDDLSVAGFEDDLLSRYLFPPLTSLSLPAEGMGATAAAMVLDRIEGSRRPSLRPVVLPTSLSIRMSCAEAPGNGSSERNRSPTRLRPRKPARGG